MENRIAFRFSSGLLAGSWVMCIKSLPDDARIIGTKFSPLDQAIEILIESKEFPVNEEGKPYPRAYFVVTPESITYKYTDESIPDYL